MPPAPVTNEQVLAAVQNLHAAITAINGRVRATETKISALQQWRDSYERDVSDVICEEIKSLREKINLWSVLLGVGELAIAIVIASIIK